jgi:hypothetical protein
MTPTVMKVQPWTPNSSSKANIFYADFVNIFSRYIEYSFHNLTDALHHRRLPGNDERMQRFHKQTMVAAWTMLSAEGCES